MLTLFTNIFKEGRRRVSNVKRNGSAFVAYVFKHPGDAAVTAAMMVGVGVACVVGVAAVGAGAKSILGSGEVVPPRFKREGHRWH